MATGPHLDRLFAEHHAMASAYAAWRCWEVQRLAIAAERGSLGIRYLVAGPHGVRYYFVSLAVIRRWAQEHGLPEAAS